MRLAISNIAWDVADDAAMAELLARHRVDVIDIAPGKYFPQPALADTADILRVRQRWADRGVEITGMQALLFGTTGLNLFGDAPVRQRLLEHLGAVCRIGGVLGARRLVFGSPRNRDRQGLDDAQALDIATDFFRRLGDVAAAQGVTICLEPNPVVYGANFMTTSAETEAVVRAVGHPAIRMQFDTGSLLINHEPPGDVLASAAALIGHIHLSEPGLVPLGDGAQSHGALAAAIREHLGGELATIEMVATQNEPPLQAIDRALHFARNTYQCATENVAR